jgi:hypothetical protein
VLGTLPDWIIKKQVKNCEEAVEFGLAKDWSKSLTSLFLKT